MRAVSFLNSFLNLEQVPKPHSRIWNLKRMRELLSIFGHPERGLFIVLIAGTKGKGSTGYFLSEILRRSGLSVGFYHSPHLESPRERIWMGGHPVSERDFSRGLFKIEAKLKAVRKKSFTYFEILTLLACLLFKEKGVETAVFEVGMGGRLDATHALPTKLAILTPIHFDHEAYLGNTLAEIAREKAAILSRGRDVIVAPQEPEAWREIKKMARKRNCRIWSPLKLKGAKLQLRGDFQRLNASVAIRAAFRLKERYGFPVTRETALQGVGSNHWPGRMELFKGKPSILLDGAHNPKSTEVLARNLKKLFPRKRKIVIFGTSRDKKSERMFPFLARAADLCILTRSSNTSRAKEVAALLKEAQEHFPLLLPVDSSKEALALARRLARPEDLIVVTGSFYLLGELRPLCRN